MKDKIIRGSSRGLTFSFPSQGRLSIGSSFDYLIDKSARSITLMPSDHGRYRISRKKAGEKWNSLVDLRNKEVMDAVSGLEQIRISFVGDDIIISDGAVKKTGKKKSGIILRFPRAELQQLRLASGISNNTAVSQILSGAQITFDEYLASLDAPVSIPSLHETLADVYTVVSLFSGAGILDWPFFQDPNFHISYALDYSPAAVETYRQNIGTHVVCGDVHKAFTEDGFPLDTTVSAPDVIIGGPSCKPFSSENRRRRLEDHPDSDLIIQYMRIVASLRPKVFAMENVPEILTACDGTYFGALKDLAAQNGYDIEAKIVQDNKVGGYTTRRRTVVLGSRVGPIKFPALSLVTSKTVKDALCKVDSGWSNYNDVTIPSAKTQKRMSFVPQGGNYTSIPMQYRTSSRVRHSNTYRRLALDEAAPTIVNWRKPPLIHPTENRTFSVAEAKSLQGLPGTFKICGSLSDMQQQVGNCVPVAIGRYIKNAVLAMLDAAAATNRGICNCLADTV